MNFGLPIPGETPIDDLSGLKIKGITTRAELNVFEAANIRKAVVKYLARKPGRKSAPFDLTWALRLHRQMFGDVWKWAGCSRKTNKNIGVPWMQVEGSLHQLLGDLTYREKQANDELLVLAVWLHHRTVQIHPFENGNGRWARLLTNIWLRLHDHPLVDWPKVTVGQESAVRNEYLNALRQADGGNLSALLDLHRRMTPAE